MILDLTPSSPEAPATTVSPRPSDTAPSLPHRQFWRVDEAAALLSVSKTTVRNLIECGQLEAGHVGLTCDGRRLHLRITARSLAAFQRARFGLHATADL